MSLKAIHTCTISPASRATQELLIDFSIREVGLMV
jgi:hypothetical protein